MSLNMDIGAARQEAIAVLDITAGGPVNTVNHNAIRDQSDICECESLRSGPACLFDGEQGRG